MPHNTSSMLICAETHNKRQCNIIIQFLQKEKRWKYEFSYTLTKQFLPYFFTFQLDQNRHDVFLSLMSSLIGYERLKTKLSVTKWGMQKPRITVRQLCLLRTIRSSSNILILSSAKLPQKNSTFLQWNFLHYLNTLIKF